MLYPLSYEGGLRSLREGGCLESWSIVARGETSSSSEVVAYNGSTGHYYWRVVSYSGSGNYSFGMTRP